MPAYYNEFDPYASAWLRNLIAAGLIAPGDVDERSITDVRPDDLRGYEQCHFFAGIGGWSYAMRLAGWPDDRPVWTGSCPCQPFSAAGKQRGSDDERHLWPAFFDLIRECGPRVVFGEQVAGASGAAWWDHVAADLEGAGYAAAAANLGAHSVGAPHIRQRLYWVAHTNQKREGRTTGSMGKAADLDEGEESIVGRSAFGARNSSSFGNVADTDQPGPGLKRLGGLFDGDRPAQRDDADRCGEDGRMADLSEQGRSQQPEWHARENGRWAQELGRPCDVGILDNSQRERLERYRPDQRSRGRHSAPGSVATTGQLDAWADIEWIACSDGKARPAQPGIFPLAHGIPGRVGRLRAYGNAIVPQVAAVFVMANAAGNLPAGGGSG